MKKCSVCRLEKDLSEFGKKSTNKDGLHNRCKPCHREGSRQAYERRKEKHLAKHREWTRSNPGYEKNLLLKRRYGITLDEYNRLLQLQDFKCAICGIHQNDLVKKLCVDHDHKHCPKDKACPTCIRGIICSEDNMKLGKFEQQPDKMPAEFVAYVLQYEKRRLEDRSVLDGLSCMS